MRSKFTEAFDSLKSNEEVKNQRVQRVLLAQSVVKNEKIVSKKRGVSMKHLFKSKRGVALLTAAAVVASTVAVTSYALLNFFGGGLQNIASILKDTFVDMDGVTAFAVGNAPDDRSDSPYITAVAQVNAYLPLAEQTENEITSENDSALPEGWDENFDWESDDEWDSSKDNVLIAIDEDGKMNEVVYERTNGQGEVRQDVLGNAAAMYVSKSFTYVMYLSDQEWEWWKKLDYAQRIMQPANLWSSGAEAQTVVIHNATGKVFPLSDLSAQVCEQWNEPYDPDVGAELFKEDFLCVTSWKTDHYPQWYSVVYDETNEIIRYEYIIPQDPTLIEQFTFSYNVRSVRRDKYGQNYLLLHNIQHKDVYLGLVNLSDFTLYDNALIFHEINAVLHGTDGRMYAFHEGKLKVFGEDFVLSPVEAGTEVALEGIAARYPFLGYEDQLVYKLQDGYLYSMFGQVWKVEDDGAVHEWGQLEGSFPSWVYEGYLIGGEIIAIVDTEPSNDGVGYQSGRIAHITFDSSNGEPRAIFKHIMKANQVLVRISGRMIVEQNERPFSPQRGNTKYFLLTVQDGVPNVEYVAYGYEGGVEGLAKPITEPLNLS